MLHRVALAAMLALLPIVASAQEEHRFERPGTRAVQPPGPPGSVYRGGPIVGPPGPVVRGGPVVGPPGPVVRGGPVVGPQDHVFSYGGRSFERVHIAPFVYPRGFGYRRWVVGGILPPLFLTPTYFYDDWAGLGLAPPPPGTEWVRYGPDLLLVDLSTGQVVDVAYGVFY